MAKKSLTERKQLRKATELEAAASSQPPEEATVEVENAGTNARINNIISRILSREPEAPMDDSILFPTFPGAADTIAAKKMKKNPFLY
jgi:hypothetical protein